MASQRDKQGTGAPDDRVSRTVPRSRRGGALGIALLIILVGFITQIALVVGSGGAIGPLQLSLALLALAPLAGAVAGVLWLVRRFRGR